MKAVAKPKSQRKATAGRQALKAKPARAHHRKGKSLSELNEWVSANHAALLAKARENCVRLTGKPTFGGTKGRKSA